MTVFLDTNIIFDYIAERPFYKNETKQIFEMIYSHKIKGVIAAHSITNLWYICRNVCDDKTRRKLISSLIDSFEIAEIDKEKIKSALQRDNFVDFEDCLQDECAKKHNSDFIITRDKKNFVNASVPVLFPSEFLE